VSAEESARAGVEDQLVGDLEALLLGSLGMLLEE
jgi:hypothetical protein